MGYTRRSTAGAWISSKYAAADTEQLSSSSRRVGRYRQGELRGRKRSAASVSDGCCSGRRRGRQCDDERRSEVNQPPRHHHSNSKTQRERYINNNNNNYYYSFQWCGASRASSNSGRSFRRHADRAWNGDSTWNPHGEYTWSPPRYQHRATTGSTTVRNQSPHRRKRRSQRRRRRRSWLSPERRPATINDRDVTWRTTRGGDDVVDTRSWRRCSRWDEHQQ